MSDFSDVKVGDKLWSIHIGDCQVLENWHDTIKVAKIGVKETALTYYLNGNYYREDLAPSLYWSKPEITGGEKPKPKKLFAYNDKYGVVQHQITDDGLIINRRNIEYHRCEEYDIEYKD